MKGSILVSIGIALLALSLFSINAPIHQTIFLTNHYSIYIPPIAYPTLNAYENDSNVTVYVLITYNNGSSVIEKVPFYLTLSSGYWQFSIYNETYPKIFTKLVNVTVNTTKGIFIYQKTVSYTRIITTRNGSYPALLQIDINKVNLIQYVLLDRVLGLFLTLVGAISLIFDRFIKIRSSKMC
ncbi:hypothetical protein BFU36_07930 [Sulfolobus sp. A20]|uniref:hypothetical protein n=1 Tax=Sulfolobaceae TaxID=118883 RepID=UPI000845F3BC|nr:MULTISPECIES: hypothetical protein [unclassified Sulfolobus]TRM78616.1 hypothetical protein DJ528_04545 [Sulfolobus sp. B5]TRM83793.1 hypothetical protein DJ531_03735 [Sulfolobus sp. A20-N-F6]TRM84522.1 hypothetical protein DJ522_04430 [Sulfolobus sp. F3]TRM88182.1 hypothetical protein DJ521_02320 [Sulfolobus sp. E3]TRM89700.1 hypothetical protein DJ529_01105 [Sulfolobus sp. C3]TRM99236.1 hypothetical protein DJ530_09310 [Sulfolobus sp. E1]TRM99836.1 hypothetical protein DJ527_08070 [Sulf